MSQTVDALTNEALALDPEAAEALSPLAGRPLVVAPIADAPCLMTSSEGWLAGAPILVGLDEAGATPPGLEELFDVLLTTAVSPPRPWVSVANGGAQAAICAIEAQVLRCPVAASVFASVLRAGEGLAFAEALILESLAYSTLLGGQAFRAWRQATPVRVRPIEPRPFVQLGREGERLIITLARPQARNALCAALRDELVEALRLAMVCPDVRSIELRGQGSSFCAGGDLNEFGAIGDLAVAYAIRTLRSPARLVFQLGERVTAHLHGGCIGGGMEIAAAAARVIAAPDTYFRLPEVGMGLIPGAGGTVSLPRRIGRHRTAFLGLSGLDLDASAALEWGLIDAMELNL